MSDQGKHRKAVDFLRYLKGEMTREERYSFERDLEADPFEREAMEGLQQIDPARAEEDLLKMRSTIGKRVKRKRRITYYSIAATIASLLVVGTIFLRLYDFNPEGKQESRGLEEEVFSIPEEEPTPSPDLASPPPDLSSPSTDLASPEGDVTSPEGDVTMEKEHRTGEEPEEQAIQQVPGAAQPEQKRTEPDQETILPSSGQENQLEKEARESDETDPITYLEAADADHQQAPEADHQQAPEADSQNAISTDQVIAGRKGTREKGRAMQKSVYYREAADMQEQAAEAAPSVEAVQLAGMEGPDAPEVHEASPVGGMNNLRAYLEKEIRLPGEPPGGDSARVLLQFVVRSDGKLAHFKAIESPGKAYSREAIRLVSEGPVWNPAIRSDVPVDDTIRLNIPFHP